MWIVALLLAAVGGTLGYLQLGTKKSGPVQYRTEQPTRGAVIKQVTATGTLSPRVTVSVGSQVSGRIKEILVDYNSVVKKGQVIARLDDQSITAALNKARANVTAARANLTKAQAAAREAKLQYERDRGLAAQKVVAPAEVQTRLASYQSASAQVTASRASLSQAKAAARQAEIDVGFATIISPIDGVVITRSVDVGQTVSASLQAPTLFLIAEDLRKMEIHTSVAESDVGQLAEGMKVRFTVDAHANQTFDGTVKQVRYEAQTVQNVVTYDAVVSVENTALKLRPGMTANVTFVIDERDDVLRVPAAALRYRPASAAPAAKRQPAKSGAPKQRAARPRQKNQRAVWVLRTGKPTRVPIKVGLSDGSQVELVEGQLTERDQVITATVGESSGAKKAGAQQASASSQRPGRRGGRIF